MTVNALVTGLIVFRIFKVFQESKTCTVEDQILGITRASTLQPVMFIVIESGMALFLIQLTRLVVSVVITADGDDHTGDAGYAGYCLIVGVHEMLNVIIRSITATLFY